MRANTSTAFASVLIGAIAALSAPADAACKKFGFTVNDYGKEGPTNDAKNLLDKHIAEWAAQNSVGEYSTGKKSVSCELFLDVILFDEHTCTASATVCWGPDAKKLGTTQSAAAPAEESASGAPPAPVRKAHALGEEAQQAAAAPAATAPADAAPAQAENAPAQVDAAQVDAAPTQPVEQIAAPADAPPAAPAVHATTVTVPTPPAAPAANAGGTTGAVVETGALQAGQALPQAATQAAKAPAASEKDRAAAAAAAASAAAAAERAAMAAETAANAAKEAAAAAVAASAASKGGATVPPLDHASGAKPVHAE